MMYTRRGTPRAILSRPTPRAQSLFQGLIMLLENRASHSSSSGGARNSPSARWYPSGSTRPISQCGASSHAFIVTSPAPAPPPSVAADAVRPSLIARAEEIVALPGNSQAGGEGDQPPDYGEIVYEFYHKIPHDAPLAFVAAGNYIVPWNCETIA